MKISDDPIVSRDVTQRASEKDQLRKNQQKQMEDRLVQSPSHAFQRSIAASGDTYVAEALKKVRKSKITHPESLTRFSGTWLQNQMMKPSEET